MQTDSLENKQYKSMKDVFTQRIKAGGIQTFYKGLSVTLVRAIFVNAGGFCAFETSMRMLGRENTL